MKKLVFAIATAGLIATPVFAADMAVKAPPMAPAPVFSWTGFYLGGDIGVAWGRFDPTSNFTCPTGSVIPSCAYALAVNQAAVDNALAGSLSATGGTAGIEAGYNWQLNSAVIGIETDFNAFLLSVSRTAMGNFPAASTAFTASVGAKTDWLYTLRGRLGWTVTPNLLIYGTGGLAVTEIQVSNAFADNFAIPTIGASSSSSTKTGWTAGGGLEWAFSQNWTAKAEYLYLNFNSVGTTLVTNTIPGVIGPNHLTTSADLHANIVRVGVNYLFH